MEVIKEQGHESGYNFYLKQDNKILEISFEGNLDLYWSLHFKSNKNYENLSPEEIHKERNKEKREPFIITKENYFIYSLFETLIDDIKETRVFIPSKNSHLDDHFEDGTEDKSKKRNQKLKNHYLYKSLFNGNKIEWHSDDDEYSVADTVIIKKIDDNIVLEFIQPKITEDQFSYRMKNIISIRFRNSGSRYGEFYVIFMRMYNKLQDYDPNYHQIHIEELIHQKKLILKK